ncbi:hypothetical protein A9Q89_06810 [Gammaproteobacteria bacterium 53_120_T64]|nr:hypothetical protein A9Q89_06810 [Gammaproteobacteria bacterium 53_120_T64]
MAYLTLVNQHLSSARLLLGELRAIEDSAVPLRGALEQSVLQLLNCAYICQLRHIGDNYHCADVAAVNDVPALLKALGTIGKPAPEATELAVLLDEGWLGELLRARRQLCLPASLQTSRRLTSRPSQSAIALHDDSGQASLLNADTLQQWLLAIEELVQRHCAMMIEY